MSDKVLKRVVKILSYAGTAKPTAKLGQALGPLGLNMAMVCKVAFLQELNELSKNIRPETPIRANLYAYIDKTYTLELQSPPTSWMIKRAAGIQVKLI
jgi:large subunit ribosomal protein L11